MSTRWRLEGNRLYGTTYVFRAGSKLNRKGLPPKTFSMCYGMKVMGTNCIGESYDHKKDRNWEFYKQDWLCFLKPRSEYVDRRKELMEAAEREWEKIKPYYKTMELDFDNLPLPF